MNRFFKKHSYGLQMHCLNAKLANFLSTITMFGCTFTLKSRHKITYVKPHFLKPLRQASTHLLQVLYSKGVATFHPACSGVHYSPETFLKYVLQMPRWKECIVSPLQLPLLQSLPIEAKSTLSSRRKLPLFHSIVLHNQGYFLNYLLN